MYPFLICNIYCKIFNNFFFYHSSYNRNNAVEEFESLTSKLCERYIGAETQSTCTVWFSKPPPGSAKKRSLLARRNSGQSPGKRLSHLTRRRKVFSSANLQGLALNNKKLLVLNIKYVSNWKFMASEKLYYVLLNIKFRPFPFCTLGSQR